VAEANPARVLLVGVSPTDLDRLQRVVSANPALQIAGTMVLDESRTPRGSDDGRSRTDEGTVKGAPFIREQAHNAGATAVMLTMDALARMLPPAVREPRAGDLPLAEALTARERDVLAYVAEGHGNREIGQILGISEHTVKFHLASIYGKLGAGNRTEAVQHALRMGLLEI
jgi:DNA-binding CsgD family transcriptional regulator